MEDKRIKWLKENYATAPWEEIEQTFPELTRKMIRARANHMGLKRSEMCKKGRIFSTDDINWLKENYRFSTNEELKKRFPGIPISKIRHRAAQEGCKKDESVKGLGFCEDDLWWIITNYPIASWNEINAHFPNLTNEQIMYTAKRFGVKRDPSVRWPMFKAEDDLWLLANFSLLSWTEILNHFPNFSRQQIEGRAYTHLGLHRETNDFTVEEINLIKKYYDKCKTIKEFVENYMPNRTECAVQAKASKMGVLKRKKWTQDEDAVLLTNYYKMKRFELINLLPQRTVGAIDKRLKQLGLIGYAPGYKYTQSELEFIKNNFEGMTDCELGDVLHREPHSIKELRRKLKLYRRNPDEDTNYKNLGRFFRSQNSNWKKEAIKRCNKKCLLSGEDFEDIHHLYSNNLLIRDTLLELGLTNEDIDDINTRSGSFKNNLIKEYRKQIKKHPPGLCLSEDIHVKFHSLYGFGDNTPQQFIEFVTNFFPNKLDDILKYIQQNYN